MSIKKSYSRQSFSERNFFGNCFAEKGDII